NLTKHLLPLVLIDITLRISGNQFCCNQGRGCLLQTAIRDRLHRISGRQYLALLRDLDARAERAWRLSHDAAIERHTAPSQCAAASVEEFHLNVEFIRGFCNLVERVTQ